MRGADDPSVRAQAIEALTRELLDAVKQLKALGLSRNEIEMRLRQSAPWLFEGDTD